MVEFAFPRTISEPEWVQSESGHKNWFSPRRVTGVCGIAHILRFCNPTSGIDLKNGYIEIQSMPVNYKFDF